MNRFLMFIVPGLLVLSLLIPFGWLFAGEKKNNFAARSKRAIRINLVSFFGVVAVFILLSATGAFAVSDEVSCQIEMANAIPVVAKMTVGAGLAYLGAALSTGLAALGAGIAVGAAAPAAIGACSEDPKAMGKSLVFIALGEGAALYGMLISIMIVNNLS